MYDTVSAILGEVPPSITESPFWRHDRTVLDRSTGELSRTRTLNEPGGLMLTLHGDGRALKVERSLPKLYRGQNIDDLAGPAVSVSLGMLDAEIGEALGSYEVPTVASWSPVRADYPRSIDLGDQMAVLRTLDVLRSVSLPYKGLPVVGQSHSLTWSKGSIKVKAYSKFSETDHDPRAAGILRIEPGVFRLSSFRRLLGLGSDEAVSLLDVLTPEMHERVNDRFAGHLRGDVMTATEISDLDLFRQMLDFFGARRTAWLLGWATVFGLSGVKSRADILACPVASVETRYRVLREFRGFRAHLVGQGFSLSPDGDPVRDVEVLFGRVVHAA